MTNLDHILKKEMSLQTKIYKAVVFPVVKYRHESWTIKKAEHQRIGTLELVLKTLESPLDCKEIKPVGPKENQPRIFTGMTNAQST